jgi:hypothetical protein
VATCFVHHDGGKDGGVQEERPPRTDSRRRNWLVPGARTHRPTLRAAGTLQGVPPSCCERRVAVWSGVCSSRHQGLDKAREQPANLAVEGAEESLSILTDYKPTVRPPPKRC